MTIRKATIQDKEQIMRLMDEFNRYYYEENIFPQEYLPFWEYKNFQKTIEEASRGWLEKPEYFMFVADENNKIVGYICGEVRDREPRVMDKEGYILDWFVSKNWRQKGIGTKLYETLYDAFKKHGCNRLGLDTNINNKATIDFYHKLGFIDANVTMVNKLD